MILKIQNFLTIIIVLEAVASAYLSYLVKNNINSINVGIYQEQGFAFMLYTFVYYFDMIIRSFLLIAYFCTSAYCIKVNFAVNTQKGVIKLIVYFVLIFFLVYTMIYYSVAENEKSVNAILFD
jgi:hypothetical protein